MKGKFLSQVMREPTREGTLLDLFFVNREEPVGDVIGWRLPWAQQS